MRPSGGVLIMTFIVQEYKKGKLTKVSGELSTPKFCADFIELAVKQGKYNKRDLAIYIKQGRKFVDYQKVIRGGQ